MNANEMKLFLYLEQDAAENERNKKNIRTKVKEDIEFGLEDLISQAVELIKDYMSQEYWDSKNTRLLMLGDPEEVVMDALSVTCALTKDTPVQQVAGPLGSMLGFDDVFQGVQTAAEILGVLSETRLLDIVKIPNKKGELRWHVRNNIELEPETYKYIDGCEYLKPLITKPMELHKTTQSGYMSFNRSVLIGKTKHHDGELCLDVLNIQNAIPLCLDEGTLEYEEEPTKDLKPDALYQFNIMAKRSEEIYEEMKGNPLWLCYGYDGRGRLYARGYWITYQSTQYKRALINIDKLETITGE